MENYSNILEIPLISRARAYRLYDYKGNRIIDMYQNKGHAVLGHRAYKLAKIMKNVISKGLIFNLPSIYSRRLEKMLTALFPTYKSFRIYNGIDQVMEAASSFLEKNIQISQIIDPALHLSSISKNNQISFWRPFLLSDMEKNILNSKLLIPILPFSAGDTPQILCFKEKIPDNFKSSSIISPFILAGTVRALADIKNYIKPEWSLENFIDHSYWKLNNIYISPQFDEKQYKSVYNNFLSNNVLLSPLYPGPSIMPSELSANEIKKVQNLFLNNAGVKI